VVLQGRRRDVNGVKVLQERENVHSRKTRDGSNHGSESAKDLGEGELQKLDVAN